MAQGTTITVREVFYRVSVLLQDIAPTQFVRWSERELIGYYNDGLRALAKFLPHACSRLDAVQLAPGSRQSLAMLAAAKVKPGDGSVQNGPVRGVALLDIVRNLGSDGLTPGAPVRVVPREMLDNTAPGWHAATGAAVEHFTYDPRLPMYFYVSPAVPVATPVWVELAYVAAPEELVWTGVSRFAADSADSTLFALADLYVDDMVHYMTARAYLKDAEIAGNGALAQLYTQLFTSSLNAQVQSLTGQNPNLSFLPFAPQAPGTAR